MKSTEFLLEERRIGLDGIAGEWGYTPGSRCAKETRARDLLVSHRNEQERRRSQGLPCWEFRLIREDAEREVMGDEPTVPPCFPPAAAQAHAAELRQALADLLEWEARVWKGNQNTAWKEARRLMKQIRDEEDAAREGRS